MYFVPKIEVHQTSLLLTTKPLRPTPGHLELSGATEPEPVVSTVLPVIALVPGSVGVLVSAAKVDATGVPLHSRPYAPVPVGSVPAGHVSMHAFS